jgi:hypothetical protein
MGQFLPTLLTKIINFDPVILVNAIQSLAKVAVYLFYPILYNLFTFGDLELKNMVFKDATAVGHYELSEMF